jgi:hypothetical protein
MIAIDRGGGEAESCSLGGWAGRCVKARCVARAPLRNGAMPRLGRRLIALGRPLVRSLSLLPRSYPDRFMGSMLRKKRPSNKDKCHV